MPELGSAHAAADTGFEGRVLGLEEGEVWRVAVLRWGSPAELRSRGRVVRQQKMKETLQKKKKNQTKQKMKKKKKIIKKNILKTSWKTERN